MGSLLEQIEKNIRERGLFRRGQRILAAVSGGVDSMVLLHALNELSKKHRWKLAVAHFNHKLRGRSSDADERFVRNAAKKFRLKFVSESADVQKFAKQGGLSIEMAARKLRHDFLARAAARLKIPTVALAHHADDQVETFFLRLLRGAGGEGLAGMKWKNNSPGNPKIKLVRPLLDHAKSALSMFAKEHQISFREDATNAVLDYQRNRIRRELLPLLRRYQPALDKTILRVMEVIGADAEFVSQAAKDWLASRPGKSFGGLEVGVQRRCLQAGLLSRGLSPDFDLIEFLRVNPGRAISVAPGLSAFRDGSGQINLRREAAAEFDPNQKLVRLSHAKGEVVFDGAQVKWSSMPFSAGLSPSTPKRNPQREFFDADKIGAKIFLRHWQPGDRFQPIGMSRAVKLQDLFTNAKIPRDERHRLIVATTAGGEIFWVERLRLGERFKLDSRTSSRLKWQWLRH